VFLHVATVSAFDHKSAQGNPHGGGRMKTSDARELKRLDRITRELAETKSIKDVKGLRDQAEAVRHYAKTAARGLKFQNEAAVVKLQAERRGGQILIDMAPHGGDHKSKGGDIHMKLTDLGISRHQSARWRQIAAVPENVFLQYVAKANEQGEEITDRGLLKFARQGSTLQSNGRQRKHGAQATTEGELFSVDGKRIFSTAAEYSDAQQFSEIVNDLNNHRVLLEKILTPLGDGKKVSITRAECRHVLHLLQEFGVLIGNLQRLAFVVGK
jgi:hypothetical protein